MTKHLWDPRKPFGGSLYPATQFAAIVSTTSGESLVYRNDRCQAVTSAKPGQLLVLVGRLMVHADGYGINEPMKVNGRLQTKFSIELGRDASIVKRKPER